MKVFRINQKVIPVHKEGNCHNCKKKADSFNIPTTIYTIIREPKITQDRSIIATIECNKCQENRIVYLRYIDRLIFTTNFTSIEI